MTFRVSARPATEVAALTAATTPQSRLGLVLRQIAEMQRPIGRFAMTAAFIVVAFYWRNTGSW